VSGPERRRSIWPWAVVALLAATVLKYAIVLAMISGDPTIAIEEDYYGRAIAWDDSRATRAASDALGWSARISIGPDRLGRAEARVEIADGAGAAIRDAAVSARIFHHSRAGRAWEGDLPRGEDGIHRATVPGARRGLWRVELEARRGAERFLETRTVDWGAP
jgi:hypothetical protein